MITHGRAGAYRKSGCRCPDCTSAHNLRQQQERLSRSERLAEDPSLAPHGTASTYRNWGCRCYDCTAAHSGACRRYNARVRVERAVGGAS